MLTRTSTVRHWQLVEFLSLLFHLLCYSPLESDYHDMVMRYISRIYQEQGAERHDTHHDTSHRLL